MGKHRHPSFSKNRGFYPLISKKTNLNIPMKRNPTKFDAQVITHLHPLFKGLLWVSVARSDDETRYALQHVHVETEGMLTHIVATDGRRIHIHTHDPGLFDTDIEEIEDGDYEVVAKSGKLLVITPADSSDLKFPNWRALLPITHERLYKSAVVSRESISSLGMRSGVLLATDFALEACGFGCGFGKDETVRIEYYTEGSMEPMAIKHALGKAIVMPMRMPGGEDAETLDPRTEADMTPMNPALASLARKVASGEVEIEINGKAIGMPDEEEHEDEEPEPEPDSNQWPKMKPAQIVNEVANFCADLTIHPDTRIKAIHRLGAYLGTDGLIQLKEHKLRRQYSNVIENAIDDLIAAEQEGGDA